MAGALNLAFPSSKVLTGWWKQLPPAGPRELWVGQLFLQRVEALAHLVASTPLDQLNRLLLEAVRLEAAPTSPLPMLERLQGRLHFPVPILHQLVRNLSDLGLVRATDNAGWALTDIGSAALETHHFPQARLERRLFSFLERLDADGHRLADPCFVALHLGRGQSWQPPHELPFHFEWLHACQGQSPAWKRTYGYPEEIDKIVLSGSDVKDWKSVVVLRPERCVSVLVKTDAGLQAYHAKPDGWTLSLAEPLFTLSPEALAAIPELTPALDASAARQAWRHIAEGHKLSAEESDACAAEATGSELQVRVPEALQSRVRFRGDDCVLVGEGCVRKLLKVTIVR